MFGSQASILNINSVKRIHRGEYSCVVSNPAGKIEYGTMLEVNGIERCVDIQFHPKIKVEFSTFELRMFPNIGTPTGYGMFLWH